MPTGGIIEFTKRELQTFEVRLHKLEVGDLRTGVTDGTNWTETTTSETEFARAKIAELQAFLESVKANRT